MPGRDLSDLESVDFFFSPSRFFQSCKDPPGIAGCLKRGDLDNITSASANPKKAGSGLFA